MAHTGPLLLAVVLLLPACATETPVIEPQALEQASPFRYPVGLWDQGVQGDVVILLRVTKAGTVDSSTVFQSSGHAELDSAALAGGRELRFVPARRGRRLLDRWVKIPVRFSRDSIPGLLVPGGV